MPLENMSKCFQSSILNGITTGVIYTKDGTPYFTEKGGFRNHPCTVWAAQNHYNTAWLIQHGCALSREYTHRYGKIHGCAETLFEAKESFIRRQKKQSSAVTWQLISLVLCLMSSNMMTL